MKGLFQGRNWLGNAQLPHPPIMDGILQIVENAIREAWRQLLDTADLNEIKTAEAYENQVTEALWKFLENIRLQTPPPIPGYCPDQFDHAPFDSVWRNINGASIGKRPDLVFKFHGKRPDVSISSAAYDGLFVECKPIDSDHPIKKHYLNDGLSRFIDGTYAWAMQDAMMLGYVGNGSNINNTLVPILSKPAIQESLKMSGPPTPCKDDHSISERCETQHNRECIYQHTEEKAGMIRVRHLWLSFDRSD